MKKKPLLLVNKFISFSKFIAFANFILLGTIPSTLFAQTPNYYNGNAGSSSNAFPLNSTTNRVQWLYGPNVFKSAGSSGTPSGGGTITKVYFRIGGTASATATYTNYTISLAQSVGTINTWTSGTYITGLTQCFYQSSFQLTGATANSWYGINLQTPFSYDPSKSLIFELKVSAGTGNTVAQTSTTGLNQRIYGTYSATSGTAGTALVDFGIDLAKGSNDAGISAIKTPLCEPTLVATYMNGGVNTIDSVKINWSVNGSLQQQNKYTQKITAGKMVEVTLTPEYNFKDGIDYTIKAWTSLPNNKKDTINENDTLETTFNYQGPAGIASVSDIKKCGPGQVLLQAIPLNKGDSIVWYDASSGGNLIARGKNALTPPLVLGINTYYAQAFKISSPTSFANSMTPSVGTSSTYSGGFADITPNKGIMVDSFAVAMSSNVANATWSVYMRTGTYVGYNTTPAAWTKIVDDEVANVRYVGSYYRSYIKIPETYLAEGVTYGFYITSTPTTKCTPWSIATVTGGITISNQDMTVFQDRVCYGATEFTSPVLNRPLTWETHYRTANCPSSRYPVTVTVKPSPNGADFKKSTPFQSPVAATTNGTQGSPDIVASGDQLTYELIPPKGYTTSNYGTDWKAFTPIVKTNKGVNIPMGTNWNYTPPSGSIPGKLTITPAAALTDEFLILSMRIEDIKLYQCDSTILKHIFIAPRAIPDFKYGQPVCDGDNVIFTNTSIVSSGNILNRWDFGTGIMGDTSTNSDVVFTFPTHGTFNVTLTTTTAPYGYITTKVIPVEVTEIPKIGFKVFNACLGDSVRFANTTSISLGTIVYHWDFGNGSTSTKINPKQKYPVAGGYKVSLTATSNGCSQKLTKSAQQFARPIAKFTLPKVLCDKTDIIFTNGSTIPIGNMGYSWNFGDGSVSGFTSPAHTYSAPGAKTVKMKVVSEFGCADSITQSFILAEAPLASFTTGPVCNLTPTSFKFTGTTPALYLTNFLWNFDGESTTSTENPDKLFSVVGKKTITLTLTSENSCSDKISREIDVKLQSNANFDIADVCEDEDAVFINNSSVSAGNLIYNWKFGDGSTTSTQAPRHLYSINGISQTFNVTLVAIVPGGCSDSINKQVTVNAKPKSDFTSSPSGRLVTFSALQTGNTTYQWDFGDGGNSSSPNTQYHFLNYPSGNYNVCLSAFNAAGCFSQTCKEILITGGIEAINKLTGVKVFPNPNKGNFTVTIEEPKSDISIEVYSLLGHKIKTIETDPLKSIYSIDLNASNGIYQLKVTNGGLTHIQKVTINK